MRSENWCAVSGYEGLYAVSDAGNVMSMDYKGTGLPGILRPLTGARYLRVWLYKRGAKGKSPGIHVLVMAAFVGPRPHGLDINHKDGNRHNNALSNLEYCTKSENMKHAFRTGLQSNVGERHSRAKLTDAAVRTIRGLVAGGMSQASVATMMNVRPSAISRVCSGKRWGHVPMNEGDEQAKNPRVAG